MNIAILIKHVFEPDAGGVQRVTNNISEIFFNNGHNIYIICFTDISANYSNSKIPIYTVNNASQLRKILNDQNINILINQEGYCRKSTKVVLDSKNDKTFVVNNLHINPLNFYDNYKQFIGVFLKNHKLSFLNNFLIQKSILSYHVIKQRYDLNYIIKNTDAFVMLSKQFKPELYFLAPAVKKYDHKIFGISNPFEKPLLSVSELKKENVILFVGRLNILQKRVDLLMEIWKDLHHKLPEWKFWVVGEGEDQIFMKEYCKEHKLDRVTFFGKDNPNEYYKKAKMFHMTSAFEGFGNVLVEAQSYGCVPILFDSYSAAQDIVSNNENGILVRPFQIKEYVAETIALINNPIKLSRMGIHSYNSVDKFSYEETYHKWDEVFKSLI
jgi:glycosyltransferase involved in cell wall biosynthesis